MEQHPYVKKKLIQTGDQEIIENSWRDDFLGLGRTYRWTKYTWQALGGNQRRGKIMC